MDYQEVRKREKLNKKGVDIKETPYKAKPVRAGNGMRGYYITAGILSVMVIGLSAALIMQTTQKYGSMTQFMKTEIIAGISDTAEGIRGNLEEYADKIPYIGSSSSAEENTEEDFTAETENAEEQKTVKELILPTVEPPNTYQ